MNSNDILKSLYYNLLSKNHTYLCPNKYLDKWWECDLISITKSDYLHEYEIKVSKSDFKNDFTKGMKHFALECNHKKEKSLLIESDKIDRKSKGFKGKMEIVDDKRYWNCTFEHLDCPSYFWFVTPEKLLTLNDIPEYAGWMECIGNSIRITKPAPRLNKNKVSEDVKQTILISMMNRYWRLKLQK